MSKLKHPVKWWLFWKITDVITYWPLPNFIESAIDNFCYDHLYNEDMYL